MLRRDRSRMVLTLVRYGRKSVDELARCYDHEIESMVERLKLEVVVPDNQQHAIIGEAVGGE